MKQTRVLANLAGGGDQGVALRPKNLFNCHNYDHDVNYDAVRGKRESKGTLVPFARAASFNQTMNYATSRKAHQQVKVSPRGHDAFSAPRESHANTIDTSKNESYLHKKYAQTFKKTFEKHLQDEK